MKLGITVVYFVKNGEGWLIDLHLRYIRQFTHVPYKIYAAAGRLQDEYIQKLENSDDITVCRCGQTSEIAGKENCFYLEQLFRFAIDDGCTHIVTFHVDSFPLRHDWVEYMMAKIDAGNQLVAVERVENSDHKPHSCFMFFPVSYYQSYKPSLRLTEKEEADPVYIEYARKFSHIRDSGYGFGYQLYKDGLHWYPLRRSNRRKDHNLIAGVYEDLIFHLGGAGFTVLISRHDKIWYWRKEAVINSLIRVVAKVFPKILTVKEKIIPAFDDSSARKKINKKNNDVMRRVKHQLISNPDRYFSYLRNK